MRENKRMILNLKSSSEYFLTEASGDVGGLQIIEVFINNEYKGQYVIDTQIVEREAI